MSDLSDFFQSISVAKKQQKEELESILGPSFLDELCETVVVDLKTTKKKEKQQKQNLQIFEHLVEEISETISDSQEETVEVIGVVEEPEELVEQSLGLLAEPSDVKQQNDPLTPLNQNFATLEDLNKHYNLLVNRVQQQLSTIGGGGETRLRYLDDVVGVATNSSFYDDKFLQWNSTTNEAEFVTINSGNIVGIVTGYYGNFFDTTTQNVVGINTYQSVRLNTTDLSNQVSIANSSHIIVANSGIYNIQFSLQIDKTQGSGAHIYIWLKKNNIDVSNSATELAVQGTNSEIVAAWNFVVQSETNDYYELMWSATDPNIRLKAVGASAVVPAIPSVIVSVVSV